MGRRLPWNRAAGSAIAPHCEAGTWPAVLRESPTIAGWVAVWRPMQIYLYDWWPLLRATRGLRRPAQDESAGVTRDGWPHVSDRP